MTTRHLLVATDFSERSRAALAYAVDLARALGAEIDVLHVVPAPPRSELVMDAYLGRELPPIDGGVIADAERKLTQFISAIPHEGVTVRKLLEPGDAAATTVRIATELPSDLIVMGTHARSGFAEMVLGSVAHRVITCAPCPVVTLRGNETSLRDSGR